MFLTTILKHMSLTYQRMITHRASEYTVPLSAVNGSSRLTKLTTSEGADTADPIGKFSNWPITFELNRMADDSNLNKISQLRRFLPSRPLSQLADNFTAGLAQIVA